MSLDADLVEFDWGVWSGRPYNGAIEKEVSGVRARWRAGETELSPAGGESPAHAAVRADRFLARLSASGARAPLVVAHGRFNRILMARLLGRALGRMDEIRQRNGSLSVFEWDGSRPATPLLLDDVSHLPPEIPDRLGSLRQRQVTRRSAPRSSETPALRIALAAIRAMKIVATTAATARLILIVFWSAVALPVTSPRAEPK